MRARSNSKARTNSKMAAFRCTARHVGGGWFNVCEVLVITIFNSPRQHDILATYDIDIIAILSVCPSVRHVPVFYGSGLTYCYSFFTTRQPNHSNFMTIKRICEIPTGSPLWGR